MNQTAGVSVLQGRTGVDATAPATGVASEPLFTLSLGRSVYDMLGDEGSDGVDPLIDSLGDVRMLKL